jgi:soluble lytic murein transglycosylase
MRRIGIAGGILLIITAAACAWLYNHTSRYDYIISQAAARNGLDFYLVKALIHEESWYRPEVRGSSGELGLMQITKAAAADFAVYKGFPPIYEDRLREPELNLEIGCWYLKQSIEHFKDSPRPILFALLRYNAGEARASNWMRLGLSTTSHDGVSLEDHYLSVVDFPKTRAYARRILKRMRTRHFWY